MAVHRDGGGLEQGLARLRTASGEVAGAGFLIGADVVCTCAHVVARALEAPTVPQEAPRDAVEIEFPLLGTGRGTAVRARVVTWRRIEEDGTGDTALLRLEHPVPGTRPVPLVDGTQVWGHGFRVLGFPRHAEDGVWAAGTLRGRQGTGWLQMETGAGGQHITHGFSGTPVWDDEQGGVVGMTVAAGRGSGATTAYLIPSAELVDERILHPRCPFVGLASFGEEDAEFFHGREDDTRRLREAVRRHTLTLVAGPSGSGKSSLVRAGLLPALRTDGMTVSEVRPVAGERPAAVPARALLPLLEPDLGGIDRMDRARELARHISPDGPDRPFDPAAAAELRARVLARAGRDGHVLFVDQLEEYAATAPDAARELLGLLVALAGEADRGRKGRLCVVATVRAESLEALTTSRTAGLLSGAVQLLSPLSPEDLHRAVTAPVDAVPGVWFEPGLPERIVADAAGEPGRMPLVEFAATRLWERRDRSMLTHAAYEEIGGVAGALVGYAEDVFRTRVTPDEEPLARRLFAQLARPDDSGGYTRRPTPASDLDPGLRALARRLSTTKLVVVGRSADGEEVVDLAHEALTRLWPRLRRWLDDSRDFRSWQEELRRDLGRWERDGGTDRLLGERDLATALHWLERRPGDVSAAERDYILLSRGHQRRSLRRLRATVAALVVLVLLAAGLSVAVWRDNLRAEEQLRTQASRLLADMADRYARDEPGTSLQLALAAWTARETTEAYGELLRQYMRGQWLTRSRPAMWPGAFTSMDVTPDGGTAVIASSPGGGTALTVVKDPLGDHPRHWRLRNVPTDEWRSALSPDGSSYALATADGRVRVWDLAEEGDRRPRVLGSGEERESRTTSAFVDYSGDGRRLLRALVHGPGARSEHGGRVLSVWDPHTGRALRAAPGLLPEESEVLGAAFGPDDGTVIVADRETTVLKDLRTGRRLRAFPAPANGIAGGGEVLWSGPGGEKPGSARNLARNRVVSLPAFVHDKDVTGEYAFTLEADGGGYYYDLGLASLRTGESHRTRILRNGSGTYPEDSVAVVPGADGRPVVLFATADALMTARADPVESLRVGVKTPGERNGRLSPDGRYLAYYGSDGDIEIVPAARTDVTLAKAEKALAPGAVPVWTADSERVVLQGPGGGLTALPVRDPDGRVDLSRALGTSGEKPPRMEAVEPLHGSRIAVLTEEDGLVLVDAARGTRRAPPVMVGPQGAGGREKGPFAQTGQLRARPGRPDEIAVVTDADRRQGLVRMWNLRTGELVRTLKTGRVQGDYDFGDRTAARMLFTPDGKHLLTAGEDGFLHRWDVDRGRRTGRPFGIGDLDVPIGHGHDGMLAVLGGEAGLDLRDPGTGDTIASLSGPVFLDAVIRGHRLIIAGADGYQELDLRGEKMFEHLCAAVGRDFTGAEKDLLPDGAPGALPPDCARKGGSRPGGRTSPAPESPEGGNAGQP
ncbi:hypothetical protein GCM10010420_45300 [Streptomyces glaucosporus]|uniref:Novel STAND NTPase 1 domain-containing protein n=1 Tax=Streptomyces glaucosporus TaxID=284044 RepID=A0ABN3IQF4_9ACTN